MILRSRRHGIVDVGVHRIPPKKIGYGEVRIAFTRDIPEFMALNKVIALSPKLNFTLIVKVPAVAHDAVVGRPLSGEVRGLRGRRDRRDNRGDRSDGSLLCPGLRKRHVIAEMGRAQANNIDDCGRFCTFGHACSKTHLSSRAMAELWSVCIGWGKTPQV